MQTMLRLDGVWPAGNNALLRAVVQAGAAADAGVGIDGEGGLVLDGFQQSTACPTA